MTDLTIDPSNIDATRKLRSKIDKNPARIVDAIAKGALPFVVLTMHANDEYASSHSAKSLADVYEYAPPELRTKEVWLVWVRWAFGNSDDVFHYSCRADAQSFINMHNQAQFIAGPVRVLLTEGQRDE
jgi:hypothetical protein